MHLESLSLHNFKNFREITVQFEDRITCILGENGSGKTNLLDAIYYLSLGKSAFNPQDNQNINHGELFFSILGNLRTNGDFASIQCSLKKGNKKRLRVNGVDYPKLSEHVGKYPLVLIAPDDSDLVREHSEARRKFIDGILCQFSQDYLSDLMKYNNILKQRNAALKSLSEKKKPDKTLFEVYNKSLFDLNRVIHTFRSNFIENFKPYLNSYYSDISEDKEEISLSYKSSVKARDFEKVFRNNFERDLILQRTELGIHRDDFIFKINSHGLKKFGSQGQQKSFIISLKLAHYQFLKEEKKILPLLLLDDIFDKLDDRRISRFMKVMKSPDFGQVFMTDARQKRSRDIIKKNKIKAKFICIDNNIIKAC
ncbi:MAG TPA: DNA replication and repair protein RecF [Cyclobacteriaceae bacterium]